MANAVGKCYFSYLVLLQDTQGNIADISSADYVKQAHDKGMKVWGLIDNFTADVSTTDTLSQLSSRQNIISQLMSAAEKQVLMESMWILKRSVKMRDRIFCNFKRIVY